MEIKVAQRLQQTEEYYFSRKLREIDALQKQGKKIINLGIGSPDLPPHPSVIEALQSNAVLPHVHGYQGYKGIPALRQAISDWYQKCYQVTLHPDTEILPLMGSKEGIMHICMTYLQAGDEALIPDPGYPTYTSAVQLSGATARKYDLKESHNWQPDLEALEASDLSKVKIMWINYPHMPTGTLATEETLKALVQFAKKHQILLCHDNPYSFILNDRPTSILSVEGAMEVAIELNSLSKSSNMAGWRVGMLVGKESFLNDILRFKSNMDSGMFQSVQHAAIAALSLGMDWYDQLNAIYRERRQWAFQILDFLQCRYDPNQVGMFVWARIPDTYKDAYELSDAVLYNAHVFLTPGGIFGTNGGCYIRISLCQSSEVFEQALERISKNLKKTS
jgi:LL-diaminopimelate aminotransferase